MSDGSKLRQSWTHSLNEAESKFRTLISSQDWKRVNTASPSNSAPKKGKPRASQNPEISNVIVHRNTRSTGDDIYRLILDIFPYNDEPVTLEPWKLVLSTPEVRQEWDPAVQDASLLELLDPTVRICKTNFAIGWPANPRDTVTISRTIHDPTTVIDISTSLPRSPDEPAYLRPSPPFVRSHVSLFAWCIQYSSSSPSPPGSSPTRRAGRIRVTCFWQHDLRAVWNFATGGFVQQLCTMMVGIARSVAKRSTSIPQLIGYGSGVSLERVQFSIDRDALTIRYSIIPDDDQQHPHHEQMQGLEELHALREKRRLARAIECTLPSVEGWDVQVYQTGSSPQVEKLAWSAHAAQRSSYPETLDGSPPPQNLILLKITHSKLLSDDNVLKATVILERSGPSSGWRLNGIPQSFIPSEDRNPASYRSSQYILPDVSSIVNGSVDSASSLSIRTDISAASSLSSASKALPGQRTPAVEKSILSRVRRNYIYFSSLLQEPEAKWKRTTEARGVSVTQLDSIDPTLVVYKAEATFVGIGLWDLYGVVSSPGSRAFWDKQHEDATLLEDVNDLTELWYLKSKPAWPANARDAVLLKTVYKSPTSIHLFFFSAEDSHIFTNIPPADPNIIRAQVDLQGWVIEALSPTTTQLTLLEQSDPKGWTNKASIPTTMVSSLAGIGDFAIRCGGPPVVTRLDGAKASDIRYDHERLNFRVEYEPSSDRLSGGNGNEDHHDVPVIECQIRCDIDTWATSLDIVVDPPPQSIFCLRRHKLSESGGGLWLTFTHDSIFVDDERLLVIIRRGLGKEKGVVMVNGVKVAVDVEELLETEIKTLAKKKRAKPIRIPLDQPPVLGVIRRRREEWGADIENTAVINNSSKKRPATPSSPHPLPTSTLSRFWSLTMASATDTTQSALSAVSLATALGDPLPIPLSKLPMQHALDALAWAQEAHSRFRSDGWAVVGEKDLMLHKKMCPEISPLIPVHKGEKVIEGVAAEELASVLSASSCRKKWDDRYDRSRVLHSYGADCRTTFLSSKANFPFRDRGFFVASIMARANIPPSLTRHHSMSSDTTFSGPRNALYCVSASFSPDFANMFDSNKYNPSNMPIGRIFMDAWILETLDPYTKENYAIPSTRCTRLVAVDYAGSIPVTVNNIINASLPRQILALESFVKNALPAPLPVIRTPSTGFLVSSVPHDDPEYEGEFTWKFRQRDDKRTLVSYHFAHEEKFYRAVMFLYFPSHRHSRDTTVKDTTPRPSMIHIDLPHRQTISPDRSSLDSTSPTDLSNMTASTSSIGSDATLMPIPDLPTRARTPSPHRPDGLPSTHMSSFSVPSTPQRPRTQSAAPTFQAAMLSPQPSSSQSRLSSRTSTTALSLKSTPPKDIVVAEIVIDSRMYLDEEGYNIRLRSSLIQDSSGSQEENAIPMIIPSSISATDSADGETILPLQFSMYTVPSSPLHSSSISEAELRHMLRATLSTAKYDIQTLEDPLTGEMQRAPERPDWLLHLEAGGRIAVVLDILPRKPTDPKNAKPTRRSKKSKFISQITINGQDVKVLDEKESLSAIGREELLPPDEGVGRWGVITRIPSSTSASFPPELETPVGVAKDLLRDPSTNSTPGSMSVTPGLETPGLETASESGSSSVMTEEGGQKVVGDSSAQALTNGSTTNSWMDYLYPRNFRIRPWITGDDSSLSNTPLDTSPLPAPQSSLATETSFLGTDDKDRLSVAGSSDDINSHTTQKTRRRRREPNRRYRTQTLVATALVAFLFGSLVRSFVAPVDYVFVPSTSVHNQMPPEVDVNGQIHPLGGQWREMKRLGEFKVKGWDVVIGAVRHHRT